MLHDLLPDALLPRIGEQVRAMHRSKQIDVDEALGISLVAIDGKALLTGPPVQAEAVSS